MSQIDFVSRSDHVVNWQDDILLYQGVVEAFDAGVSFVKQLEAGETVFTSDYAITSIAARHMRIGNDQCPTPCFDQSACEVFIADVQGVQYYIVNELRGLSLAIFKHGLVGQVLLYQLLKAFDTNKIHFRSYTTDEEMFSFAAISGGRIASYDSSDATTRHNLLSGIQLASYGLYPGAKTIVFEDDLAGALRCELDSFGSRHRVYRAVWKDKNICDSFHEFLRSTIWGG